MLHHLPKSLAYWLVLFMFLVQASVLAGLVAARVYDPRFETYQNYLVVTFAVGIFLRAFRHAEGRRVFLLVAGPLLFGTTFFIAIAITVIVQFNDGIYLKSTYFNNGTNPVAIVHSFDWILHQVPFFFVTLLLWSNWLRYRRYFRELWARLSPLGRGLFTLYSVGIAAAWELLYMASFPFRVNYPVPMPDWSILVSTAVACLLIDGGLFIGLWHRNHSQPATKKKGT